ncbi:MAG: SDR family NAD(P)-dependent oxidoreductase [Alphaproteobacteria bacterium]|mgnify:CR=1 FL=1|nr:SDR family NAD(P)-dependent oxidoreductase [Alphaproteobacteria bacterium]
MKLEGKVALVTGGASGIGRAIARRFVAEGAAVAIADLDETVARTCADGIAGEGGRALACPVDVTSPDEVRAMVDATVAEFGRLDILVTSAGVSQAASLIDTTPEIWDFVVGTNLTGSYLCARAAAVPMIAQGAGRIIHIASIAAFRSISKRAAYCASKAGVIGLMQVAATELGRHGITVNAISPGPVDSPLARRHHTPAIRDSFLSRTPMGRYTEADEIAAAAAFLASEDAKYVTGQQLAVDGGYQAAGVVYED